MEYHFRVVQIKTKKGNHGVQSGVDYYMTKSRRKFKKKKTRPQTDTKETKGQRLRSALVLGCVWSLRTVCAWQQDL